MTDQARWADLVPRLVWGFVIAVFGLGALWAGGVYVMALACVAAGVMIWELSGMTAPGRANEARLMGVIAAGTLAVILYMHDPFWLVYLLVPAVLGVLRPRRDRMLFAAGAFAIMLAAYAVVAFREGLGEVWILWVILVVIAVDVLGYFAGRIIGGPKFWPRISPKKTWSGTLAGLAGAAVVGLGFVLAAGGPGWLVPFSALVGFASQMGDIGESWIKRRAGVKDASDIIPGHGGLMDRFDGMTGALVFLLGWGILFPHPQIGS